MPSSPATLDYIDELIEEEWTAQGLKQADVCTDGEFIRRATLDLLGRIPTLSETKAFLSDRSKVRRRELIDQLLRSPEYGTNFAHVWMKLLIPRDLMGQEANTAALFAWLEREFNRNRPWNEMVYELIAATGRWDENPAVNFILANQDGNNSIRTTSNVTRLFLGVQTQCTECHDHPWNDWKQDQFHGLNAFFVGTEEKQVTRGVGGRETEYWELAEKPYQDARAKGVLFERRNGLAAFAEPTYLDGRGLAALLDGGQDQPDKVLALLGKSDERSRPLFLRQALARTITEPSNPYFAKAIVNRMWFHLLGHSFTKDVDDLENGIDEPTHPELLNRLAQDFVANGHDLKSLIRWIANSEAYGLSSQRPRKSNEEAIGFFSFQLVRPMSPEQLYDSVLTLTALDRTAKTANAASERSEFIRQFLATFGEEQLPTGTPRYDGTITQSLMMMNSRLIDRATSCVPGTFLHSLVSDEKLSDKERVEAIYLAALSRKPTSKELKWIGPVLSQARSPQETTWAYSDILWAVMNSAEFALNH